MVLKRLFFIAKFKLIKLRTLLWNAIRRGLTVCSFVMPLSLPLSRSLNILLQTIIEYLIMASLSTY